MPTRPTRPKRFTERGIALVAVAAVLAIVGLATQQFSMQTNLDYAAAVNARDEMRAHFLARSGVNLSRLVIKVQKDIIDHYRRYVGDFQLADVMPMFLGAFSGKKDEVNALVGVLGATDGDVKGLGLKVGNFDIKVTTEDGRINANCANGSVRTQQQLATMLGALVAPTAYDRVFEKLDGDGQLTDRETFVRAIIDYVDRDEAVYGANGQAEEYGYGTGRLNYYAKNNYLDSVDELKLVRGMDDKRWALFGSAFTVYGGCKVNVAAANDINVFAAMIVHAARNPEDPVLSDPMKLFALAAYTAQARQLGIMFDDLNAFAEFVKDPMGAAGGMDDQDGSSQQQAQALTGGMPLEGVELDPTKLAEVARAGGRRTYRVEAVGDFGRVTKRIIAVFDTETQNQNVRDPAYARGAWVYWREE